MSIQISKFSYKDQEFDVLLHKNKLSYIFEVGNERYGNAVEITGKSRRASVDAACSLILNLMETYDAVQQAKK